MTDAIVIREYGGPEVLRLEQIDVGHPGPDEIRLRQGAVGVNFHDVYVRSGLYKTLTPPGIPGIEAAGIVEEVGANVSGLRPGDRVGYVTRSYGCYASARLLPADRAVKLPDWMDERTAASLLLKGLTVHTLVSKVHPVKAGDWVLVHAAAGGVGRMLCQWASHLGATVIGTVGSNEKAEIARRSGCKHVILYRKENFVERIAAITNKRGVDVAYDSVGKDTFAGSLESLALCGHLVNFGQASGPVEPVAPALLGLKSLSLTRPVVFHHVAQRAALEVAAAALFDALSKRWISAEKSVELPLRDAAQAHRILEARKNLGPIVLRP
jgi:NADPH2:quinone reductase